MKLRLLFTYILLLLASMASAQVLDSSKVLLPIYKGEKTAVLDKFIGWHLQNNGEWAKAKNKIPNDRTIIDPKSDEFSIGKENISSLEMYLFTYDKKEYVVLAVHTMEGYYELPVLKSNWMTKKVVYYYVFDKRKLYRLLTNSKTKKPYSINLSVWCSGTIDNFNRHCNIKNIVADQVIKTKANVIINNANLVFSVYPATKDEEEKIYFKLTKTYTKKSIYDYYLLPQNQEKLFTRFYYEAEKENFDNFIYTILDQSDTTNNKLTPGPDEVVKPWEPDTAQLRFNIFKERPMFDQNLKDDKIQQDTMDFYNSKDKTEKTHGNSTSFSDKKDYGKTHKIKKTTTTKNVNTGKGIYRVTETTTKAVEDTSSSQNNKNKNTSNSIINTIPVVKNNDANDDALKAVRDAMLNDIRIADSLLEVKRKLLNQKNKTPDITEPGFDWNNLGQKKNNTTTKVKTNKNKENKNKLSQNNSNIDTINKKTTPIITLIENKPVVNIDSIVAVRLKEKLLLDSIEKAEKRFNDSVSAAKITNIINTQPSAEKEKVKMDSIFKKEPEKIVKPAISKETLKEIKQREKFVADSIKQEKKRLKKLEKQHKKEKGVKIMINEPINEVTNDSVIDSARIKLKIKRDSIYKASMITPNKLVKTTDDTINKTKVQLPKPIIEPTINIDTIKTVELKTAYDTTLSQGRIAKDTIAGMVFYSIQIGCLSDTVSELFYRTRLKLTDRMYLFTYGTQYKYCIGTFNKYEKAVAYLKKLVDANKQLQAYIIGFVDGKLAPISVAKKRSGEVKVPFNSVLSPK